MVINALAALLHCPPCCELEEDEDFGDELDDEELTTSMLELEEITSEPKLASEEIALLEITFSEEALSIELPSLESFVVVPQPATNVLMIAKPKNLIIFLFINSFPFLSQNIVNHYILNARIRKKKNITIFTL